MHSRNKGDNNMAKEFIQLNFKDNLGDVNLNKGVFSSIARNVIEESENVQMTESSSPFKNGITTKIEGNELYLTIPVKVQYNANVTDVCAGLQSKIFESISYMTDYKPASVQIDVVGFLF
jgi:uncharacterized alkaline shock family protein YloU